MVFTKSLGLALLLCLVLKHSGSAFVQQRQSLRRAEGNSNAVLYAEDKKYDSKDARRRLLLQTGVFSITAAGLPAKSQAASKKSRSDGYSFQRTDQEWRSMLTSRQYEILRMGGTERQYSSILEGEERDGTYSCAGCGTPLFASKAKFHSGTGWPSFATALDGVEVEQLNIIQANLQGAELRCKTCGGHLGDVFRDGYIFTGTPAEKSGKRFCIDGAALVFKSAEDGAEVIGDEVPTKVQYFYN